jgi:hypothetical protein
VPCFFKKIFEEVSDLGIYDLYTKVAFTWLYNSLLEEKYAVFQLNLILMLERLIEDLFAVKLFSWATFYFLGALFCKKSVGRKSVDTLPTLTILERICGNH